MGPNQGDRTIKLILLDHNTHTLELGLWHRHPLCYVRRV